MQVVPRCLAGICCSSQLSFNNTNYDVGLGNDDPELELIPLGVSHNIIYKVMPNLQVAMQR